MPKKPAWRITASEIIIHMKNGDVHRLKDADPRETQFHDIAPLTDILEIKLVEKAMRVTEIKFPNIKNQCSLPQG